jgi:hypothetical protein
MLSSVPLFVKKSKDFGLTRGLLKALVADWRREFSRPDFTGRGEHHH